MEYSYSALFRIVQKYQLMRLQTAMLAILPFFACTTATDHHNPYINIGAIPLPAGYTRAPAAGGSFAWWLRRLPLKKDNTVYLYNGSPKRNQSAQFAVLDISVGNKDLQQCADAVIRLRSEYLYACGRYSEIDFTDNAHIHYRLPAHAGRDSFDHYLEKVYNACGTLSLSSQLHQVELFSDIQAGDVLIKGGSPGHAMLVTDVAVNSKGKKIYLLSQSYMPAQDIHVVVNPGDDGLSPWYEVNGSDKIDTPEWTFTKNQLKRWP